MEKSECHIMQDSTLPTYLVRLFTTDVNHPPKHVYVFSHQSTEDLYHRMFTALQGDLSVNLYILDSTPGLSGYAGYSSTCDLARSYGFTKFHPVPYDHVDMVNTFTEANAVVRFFKQYAIQTYHICSPAFHLPRAFQSMVSNQPSATIYVITGTIRDWQQTIVHSQGMLKDSVSNLIHHEQMRMHNYMKKGDLVPLTDCIAYMNTYW
jgi:hypothetical protein